MILIQDAKYYSVLVDDTSDISVTEQASGWFQLVDSDLLVHKLFTGFYETTTTTAGTLYTILKDVLMKYSLNLDNCRGQWYDGASNMSGHLSGLQSRVAAEEPRALYVHCTAHSLNLVVQDSLQINSTIRDFLSLMRYLVNYVQKNYYVKKLCKIM